ncbi:alpha/beta hydrolase [Quadrisphaera sp. GCM10027208]|uniref:alpha/beta hydrolase n=1 Tax=Quadrisphaera sp. GCM10027208 TaxID=3273423 RepID=UPI0036234B95
MVTLEQVRAWRPADVDAQVDVLTRARNRLLDCDDELTGAAPPSSWAGGAADAAAVAHGDRVEQVRRLVAQVEAVRTACAEAAAALAAVHSAIAAAEDLARAHGLTVHPDGTVTAPALLTTPEGADEAVRAQQAVVEEVVDRLEQALRRAAQVDADLAAVLRRAAQDAVEDGCGASLADAVLAGATAGDLAVPPPPGRGARPADNAGWWASLTEAERAEVLARHPQWVGNLDDVRADLQAEAARLQADLADNIFGGWFTHADARLENVRGMLAGLDAVEAEIALRDTSLLVLDASGDLLEAAVAKGDVDTADHVAVFTPGMGTTVQGSLKGYSDDVDELRLLAKDILRDAGESQSVATVAWLGYQAPGHRWVQDVASLGDRSVVRDNAAQNGAPALTSFLQGVDAARGTDPHLTALGHSYGSLVTGLALQRPTGVDDVVFFGSPGIGTSDAEELLVPDGHAFVVEARGDPVADTGWFGRDPNQMDGLTGLSSREEVLDGRVLAESTGHSQYFVQDSTSQHNLAVTIAGLYDQQVHPDGMDGGDVVSSGYRGVPWDQD